MSTCYLLGSSVACHGLRTVSQGTMQIPASHSKQLASIDMGTNSFKLLLVRAHPSGRFLTVDRIKEPVVLGRGMSSDGEASFITLDAQLRAISALRNFARILDQHSVDSFSVVATSAVREAENKLEFLSKIQHDLGLQVGVLSGEDEARLIYQGVLQFLPLYSETILTVDIGGGSTEFALGKKGEVIFGTSLKLGHVTLTENFVKTGEIGSMRKKIQSVIGEFRVVQKVKAIGFDAVVGSSGTIRAIGRAAFAISNVSSMQFCRGWRFTKDDLAFIVEKLCGGEVLTLPGVSKRRSEFLLAGAILLWEIFEALGIADMEVSEYALAEGVIAEMLAKECQSFDVSANVRWRSVVRLATRFNSDNRMRLAVKCIGIAKDIFEALRKYGEGRNDHKESAIYLEGKDLEYLEAAILLHNIGLFIGKKGYHKQSFYIIKNGGHLDGYNNEEIQIIALLVRHHRKKFPKRNLSAIQGFKDEEKQKFRVLCVIMRLSLALKQFQGIMLRRDEKDDGFELVLSESSVHPEQKVADIDLDFELEMEHFREIFQANISVVLPTFGTKNEQYLLLLVCHELGVDVDLNSKTSLSVQIFMNIDSLTGEILLAEKSTACTFIAGRSEEEPCKDG
ncbi:hypothetical protein H6P81_004076 [Aristolochia fimbriata]|uniref:Exopolyphosphatase n=1 Tax=Aristolochia fimbriata TaxID=158543 RepID=A0AAV7FF74_ARIFI|nr:hypothetical protein H6P81_004076 [Aristolochia fimbriata]